MLLDVLEQVSPVNQVFAAQPLVSNHTRIDELIHGEPSTRKKLCGLINGEEWTHLNTRGWYSDRIFQGSSTLETTTGQMPGASLLMSGRLEVYHREQYTTGHQQESTRKFTIESLYPNGTPVL